MHLLICDIAMYQHPILQMLLERIDDLPFSRPVTGYLTDAYIRGSSGYGITHKHVRADRFRDGAYIHTSASRSGGFCPTNFPLFQG